MAFTTQFGKVTSLSADMSIGETSSATLASAVFTNFSNDYLVLDYNIPAKREVIKCTVTGTAISSITRGQEGTAAIAHSSGALVAYGFIPAHYKAITDGSGFETGSASVGVPHTAIKYTAATSYTPTWTATAGSPAVGNGTLTGYYYRIGNLIVGGVTLLPGSTTTFGTGGNTWIFTLPVAAHARYTQYFNIGTSSLIDTGTAVREGYTIMWTTTSTFATSDAATAGVNITGATTPHNWANTDRFSAQFWYEAAA